VFKKKSIHHHYVSLGDYIEYIIIWYICHLWFWGWFGVSYFM